MMTTGRGNDGDIGDDAGMKSTTERKKTEANQWKRREKNTPFFFWFSEMARIPQFDTLLMTDDNNSENIHLNEYWSNVRYIYCSAKTWKRKLDYYFVLQFWTVYLIWATIYH